MSTKALEDAIRQKHIEIRAIIDSWGDLGEEEDVIETIDGGTEGDDPDKRPADR